MNLRKAVSLTALFSFVVTVVTSVVLFIEPPGRVAYWSDWKLWGLTKEQWGALHLNVGILFLIALLLHCWYNWRPIVNYLADKARRTGWISGNGALALGVVLLTMVGTWQEWVPFSAIQSLETRVKDNGSAKYGEPPYGHAELTTLKTFARKLSINLEMATVALKKAGFDVPDAGMTLKDLALHNGTSPQQLFLVIEPLIGRAAVHSENQAERQTGPTGSAGSATDAADNAGDNAGKGPAAISATNNNLPENPAPGTGRLTLLQICEKYGLDSGFVVAGLEKHGFSAGEDSTLKEIASAAGVSPIEIYEQIRMISQEETR